uniref:Uncharacterized protein n=1 Tax=Heterorhabditis bacteriophora TaxID=37862 RepID=A0A1I7WSD3_HETBA
MNDERKEFENEMRAQQQAKYQMEASNGFATEIKHISRPSKQEFPWVTPTEKDIDAFKDQDNWCYHCASPIGHLSNDMKKTIRQFLYVRRTTYPSEAVTSECSSARNFSLLHKQTCKHKYCETIALVDHNEEVLVIFFKIFNFISIIYKKQFNHQNIFPRSLALPWMLLAVRGLPMNVCVFRIIVHNLFFSPVTIFQKKFFLRCLANNEMHELSRRSILSLKSSCGAYFPSLRIFPISCNHLETVALSTPRCSVSSSWVCNGFSSNNAFKASVFEIRGIPERCRSLTSKSPALKRRNQYLQVLRERTPSSSTDHIDWRASAAFFPLFDFMIS